MSGSEVIGIDIGQAKTGLARGSTMARLAEPLFSVQTSQLADKLGELSKKQATLAIVVGLPRNLNGQDTKQTKLVRQFVAELKTKFTTPFYWQDEALTSVKAESSFDEHAQAAAVILQDWLDSPEANRVRC